MQKILLTGGTGFIGSALMKHKAFENAIVISRGLSSKNYKNFIFRTLAPHTDFTDILKSINIVVHVAAKAHVQEDDLKNANILYRNLNTDSTLNLARQSIKAGVKRFIFISSIKVLGEKTNFDEPFDHHSPLNPIGPYAISKAEAETELKKETKKTNMELVIIRPPLVYGCNVKGNFLKFLKLVKLQLPLPIKSIKNKRSFVAVENLVDLIVRCMFDKKAANQTFLISDNQDLSTPELFEILASSGGFKNRLFPIHDFFLKFFFKVIGKSNIYDKISHSLQVDITYTMKQLAWKPPISINDAIKKMQTKI